MSFPNTATPQPQFGEGYYSIGEVLYYHGPDFQADDHRVKDKERCIALGWPWTKAQEDAYNVYLKGVLDSYAKSQANRTPEQIEAERAAARAAHGPGVK